MSDTTHYAPNLRADADTLRRSIPCGIGRTKLREFVASCKWEQVDCPKCLASRPAQVREEKP